MKLTIDMAWQKNLSINHMHFGSGGHYRRRPEVQVWMDVLAYYVKTGTKTREINLPVQVRVNFRFPNARRHDDHNLYKCIADAVATGLGIDDKDIRISTGTITVDKTNPGFTIHIEDGEEK